MKPTIEELAEAVRVMQDVHVSRHGTLEEYRSAINKVKDMCAAILDHKPESVDPMSLKLLAGIQKTESDRELVKNCAEMWEATQRDLEIVIQDGNVKADSVAWLRKQLEAANNGKADSVAWLRKQLEAANKCLNICRSQRDNLIRNNLSIKPETPREPVPFDRDGAADAARKTWYEDYEDGDKCPFDHLSSWHQSQWRKVADAVCQYVIQSIPPERPIGAILLTDREAHVFETVDDACRSSVCTWPYHKLASKIVDHRKPAKASEGV